MHIHQMINEQFPVRNAMEQKEAFRQWVQEKVQEYGYTAVIEATDKKKKTQNIVVGDPEKAKVVFTAHYDTPRRAIIPNLMMPRSIAGSVVYALLLVAPLLVISLGLGELAARWTGIEMLSTLVYLVVYFGAFYLMMLGGPVNPHNANDNTSGCAALFDIMEKMCLEDREKAAFIFFDNEEKGLVGSRGYAKMHPDFKRNKPVVNLDCVAYGDQILLIAKKKAMAGQVYHTLTEAAPESQDLAVHFFSSRGSMMNSDHSQFDLGMGVCACKKAPIVRFACGRIHTPRDTEAEVNNIDYLAHWMINMIALLDAVRDQDA